MTDITYRKRTVAELVDASIQLFRACYRPFATIAAIGYVPWIVASTIATRALGGDADPADLFPGLGPGLIMIVGALWFTVVSAGIVAAASDKYLGTEPDVGRSLRRALRVAWPIIGTSLLTWVAAGLGVFLLVIGFFYFLTRYILSSTVALLEGRPVIESMQRAAELSRNNKLRIFATLGAAWLIYLAIAFTIGAVVGITGVTRLAPLAEAVITIGISPLIGATTAVLYYDLRIRAEGFDVDLMERQLRASPEPA